MISEAAVEAAWDGFYEGKGGMRKALEAAAPHMLAGVEWAIFPKGGPGVQAATDLRYETREAAEKTRKESYLHPELFEVRGREVGE